MSDKFHFWSNKSNTEITDVFVRDIFVCFGGFCASHVQYSLIQNYVWENDNVS